MEMGIAANDGARSEAGSSFEGASIPSNTRFGSVISPSRADIRVDDCARLPSGVAAFDLLALDVEGGEHYLEMADSAKHAREACSAEFCPLSNKLGRWASIAAAAGVLSALPALPSIRTQTPIVTQVADLFRIVADRMRTDLRMTRAAVSHPSLRGAGFEEAFRSFLRAYLPKSLDVSTGVLVDSHGKWSRQLDVIISDAARTPVFYASGENRVIPVECAYMVFEVKSTLNSQTLEDCFVNMQSVRDLTKSAYVSGPDPQRYAVSVYGRDWPIYPVNYFVFAYDSMDLTKIAEIMRDRWVAEQRPAWSRIDTVCVLDKGVITNQVADNQFDALPNDQGAIQVTATEDALLLFYTLLSRYFNQTVLPPFSFVPYLGELTFEHRETEA
jgi:hypothetical protein